MLPEFSVDKTTVAVFEMDGKVCVIGQQELLLTVDSSDNSPASVNRGARHEIRLFVKNSKLPTKMGELAGCSYFTLLYYVPVE